MDTSEIEQTPPIEMKPNEPVGHILQTDFDHYCTLFEALIDELERNGAAMHEIKSTDKLTKGFEKGDLDLEGDLDEFDYFEIEQMRERFELSSAARTSKARASLFRSERRRCPACRRPFQGSAHG